MTETTGSGAPTPDPELPPPYRSGPVPYQTLSDEQRRILAVKGRRSVGFGVVWILAGLGLTLLMYSVAPEEGVYLGAWAPVLFGIYRIVSGYLMVRKAES